MFALLQIAGLFFAIGHQPASEFLAGQLETDVDGYITTQTGTTQTSREAVFACGDVQDKRWRQAITAAGTGLTLACAHACCLLHAFSPILTLQRQVTGQPKDQCCTGCDVCP